jgi:hypothetical protein
MTQNLPGAVVIIQKDETFPDTEPEGSSPTLLNPEWGITRANSTCILQARFNVILSSIQTFRTGMNK